MLEFNYAMAQFEYLLDLQQDQLDYGSVCHYDDLDKMIRDIKIESVKMKNKIQRAANVD